MLGAGGHASVLMDILLEDSIRLNGLVSPSSNLLSPCFNGIKQYNYDEDVLSFSHENTVLINGIGSLPGSTLRKILYEKFTALHYRFKTVVSPLASVSRFAELGPGVQVMHGAIVQAGAKIGANTIINTGAIIEHDCDIGAHNHVAPGVTLSGSVKTGECVHIGTGAIVIQSITIGDYSIIGAGSIITKEMTANKKAYGCRTLVVDMELNKYEL